MTLTELITLTKQALGNRVSALLTDSWYTERINNAYRRLCTFQGMVTRPGVTQPQFRVLRFFELEDRTTQSLGTSLVSNFVTPATPTDGTVFVVQDVFDRTNDRGLRREPLRTLRRMDPDYTGAPRMWCPAGQGGGMGYYIYPRPGSTADAISVYEYIYKYPANLTGTATPVIPVNWHDAIWMGASADGARLIDDTQRAEELEGRFLAFIAERKSPHEEASYGGLSGARRTVRVGLR